MSRSRINRVTVQTTSAVAGVVRFPLVRDERRAVDIGDRTSAGRPSLRCVEGAFRELEHTTYRGDREPVPMGVDERDRHRCRRSASNAKKVVAAWRISCCILQDRIRPAELTDLLAQLFQLGLSGVGHPAHRAGLDPDSLHPAPE